MGDLERTVKVILAGEDRVSKVLKGAEERFSKFGAGVSSVTGPLAGFSDKILKTEGALAALAAGGLALAVHASGKFGDSFNEISTLTDATVEDLARFRKEILDYSRDSGFAIEEINSAVYEAISTGADYKDALGQVAQAEKLAIAGKAGLKDATVLLATSLNAYGEGVDQAGRYSDVFFQIVRDGKVQLPELAGGLSQITTTAANAGVPIEAVGAAIAALTAKGQPTSQAITGMRGALSAIIKPTAEATKTAESLGLQFDVTALKSQGFAGFLQNIWEATNGNISVIGKLFGPVDALNSVLALAGDTSGKFAKALEDMQNAAGATEKAFEKMSMNFKIINQKLWNNIQADLVEFGDKIIDEWKDIAGSIGEGFKQISVAFNDGAFDPLFDELEAVGKKIAEAMRRIAENIPEALKEVDYSKLLSSLENLGKSVRGALEAMFGKLDLSTPKGLADAIQGIVDAITGLQNVVSGIIKGMDPLFRAIGKGISEFNNLDKETQDLMGHILGLSKSIDSFLKILPSLGAALLVFSGAQMAAGLRDLGKLGTWLTDINGSAGLVTKSLKFLGTGALVFGEGWVIGTALNKFEFIKDGAEGLIEFLDKGFRLNLVPEVDEAKAEANIQAARQKLQETLTRHSLAFQVGLEEDPDVRRFIDWSKEGSVAKLVINPSLSKDGQAALDAMTGDKKVKIKPELDLEKLALEKEKLAKDFSVSVLRIEADVDMKRIEAAAGVISKGLDFKATIDTNAASLAIEALRGSVEGLGAASGVLESIFSGLGDMSSIQFNNMREYIERQMDLQELMATSNMKLTEAQVAFLRAKMEAMRRGDALVKISADGMEPEIEAFMFRILSKIQVRANADGFEFLGIG